jgi:ABC-2 type transport system permease protein
MSNPVETSLTQNRQLAARQGLQLKTGSGRLAGFRNLITKEMGEWFGTRRWLVQALLWLILINGFLALMLFAVPAEATVDGPPPRTLALTLFFSFVTIGGSIAVIILMQDEVIQEKQTGTAAWILSKPVDRIAFLLSKWTANVMSVLLFIVILPAVVTLVEINLAGLPPIPILAYVTAAGVVALTLIFYASLVILLGVLFEQRGPLLGIAFGLLFGGMFATQIFPPLSFILPVNTELLAVLIAQGENLPPTANLQLGMTAGWSLIFIAAALWRFRRAEL